MAATVGKYHKVTHCLFDLDGLMLDTETIYEKIARKIASDFHIPLPYDVYIKSMGRRDTGAARVIIEELRLPICLVEYMIRLNRLSNECLANPRLLEGVEDLVRHLFAYRIPLALATSSSASMVDKKTANHRDLFKCFHHRVCGSSDPEVKNSKPHPDIFLVAASRFPSRPEPSNCLVFEDAPNGVAAAKAAGMQVVMIPDKRIPPELRIDATQVLESMRDFKPYLFGLPDYRGD